MAATHDKERELTREIRRKVESAVPGTEVLAVELTRPDRFTVFVDHAQGVDHALCARVTDVLRDYLREYGVEVSSPGFERPLRTPQHFRSVVGRRVALRTETKRSACAARSSTRASGPSPSDAGRIRGHSRTRRSCGAT